jgi:RNA-splicing ligase RtcB
MSIINLKGKYTEAKIFTDNIEESAIAQVHDIISSPEFKDLKVRIMPDVHAGKGIVIGFSSEVGEWVNPCHIGVDIGCGVETIFFDKELPEKDYALFEHRVKKAIPVGFDIHDSTIIDEKDFKRFLNNEIQKIYQLSKGRINFVQFDSVDDIDKWYERFGMKPSVFWHSIGSLGGGNHFLEFGVGNDSNGTSYNAFTVHTGSRNLGLKVCNYWTKIANTKTVSKKDSKKALLAAKEEYASMHDGNMDGFSAYLAEKIEAMKQSRHIGYLGGDDLKEYLTDMVICQLYARYNRKTILDIVAKIMNGINGAKVIDHIVSVHNYIDMTDGIIRKGAIRSYKDEKMVIPFNMKDGLAICVGKSNEDWNYTAPHGSGRAMSREKARKALDVADFQKQMADAGVYTTTADRSTIDEAPDAYKPFEEIVKLIEPTVDILFFVKPKINIKGAA